MSPLEIKRPKYAIKSTAGQGLSSDPATSDLNDTKPIIIVPADITTAPIALEKTKLVSPSVALSTLKGVTDAACELYPRFSTITENYAKNHWPKRLAEIGNRRAFSKGGLAAVVQDERVRVSNEMLGEIYGLILNAGIATNDVMMLYIKDLSTSEFNNAYTASYCVGEGMVDRTVRKALQKRGVASEEQVQFNVQKYGEDVKSRVIKSFEGPMGIFAESAVLGGRSLNSFYISDGKNQIKVLMMSLPVIAPPGTPVNPDGADVLGTFVMTTMQESKQFRDYLRGVYDDLFTLAGDAYVRGLKEMK